MVFRNDFSGTLPSEMGEMTDLWRLDVAENKIGGRIPPELGNLTNLGMLYLHENKFVGTFPNEIGHKIPLLEEVWFYNNDFTGTVPIGLGNHSRITSILAHGNKFTGNVSQLLCDNEAFYEMMDFTTDCFSALVDCECCFRCY